VPISRRSCRFSSVPIPMRPGTTINEIRVRPRAKVEAAALCLRPEPDQSARRRVHVENHRWRQARVQEAKKLMDGGPRRPVRKVKFDDANVDHRTAWPACRCACSIKIGKRCCKERNACKSRWFVAARLRPDGPAPPMTPGNKWTVQVEAVAASVVGGPANRGPARLARASGIPPGSWASAAVRLHVELPTQLKSPRTLFAEKACRWSTRSRRKGPVLPAHRRACPRAFVYRTTFRARAGEPKPADARWIAPAVRLVAPLLRDVRRQLAWSMSRSINAPAGCKLPDRAGPSVSRDLTFKPRDCT